MWVSENDCAEQLPPPLCYGKYSDEIQGVGSAAVPENGYFSFNFISYFNKKTDCS